MSSSLGRDFVGTINLVIWVGGKQFFALANTSTKIIQSRERDVNILRSLELSLCQLAALLEERECTKLGFLWCLFVNEILINDSNLVLVCITRTNQTTPIFFGRSSTVSANCEHGSHSILRLVILVNPFRYFTSLVHVGCMLKLMVVLKLEVDTEGWYGQFE
jgi:hypothetical protein